MSIEKIQPVGPAVKIDLKSENPFHDQQKETPHKKPTESFANQLSDEIKKLNSK